MNDEKKLKKRGRKPKTNIIVNDNPVFKNKQFNEIIVCISDTETDTETEIDTDPDNKSVLLNINDITSINKCDIYNCQNCTKKLYKNYI